MTAPRLIERQRHVHAWFLGRISENQNKRRLACASKFWAVIQNGDPQNGLHLESCANSRRIESNRRAAGSKGFLKEVFSASRSKNLGAWVGRQGRHVVF
jgi:hypothetical protein